MFAWNIVSKSPLILLSQNLSYYMKVVVVVIIGQCYTVREYGMGAKYYAVVLIFTYYFCISESYLSFFFYVSHFINRVK